MSFCFPNRFQNRSAGRSFVAMLERRLLFLGLASAIALTTATSYPATANLIFAGSYNVGGSGFGALPRALTIQSHGPDQRTESGCIAPGPTAGGCVAGSVGGDDASPIGFPKQSAPSLSSLGITNANQIGILFDAIQPQNAGNVMVEINDLTLKLYNGNSLVTTAVLSPEPLTLPTNPGNGILTISLCSAPRRRRRSTRRLRETSQTSLRWARQSASRTRARDRTATR